MHYRKGNADPSVEVLMLRKLAWHPRQIGTRLIRAADGKFRKAKVYESPPQGEPEFYRIARPQHHFNSRGDG